MPYDYESLKKKDLRIRRTHKLLSDALFELLETTHYDDISVVDICEKAMVHRATFYKHFKDKDEFIEYVTKEKLCEFYFTSMKDSDFSDKPTLYKAVIRTLLSFIEENKQMIKFASMGTNSQFYESVKNIVQDALIRFLVASEKYGEKYQVPAEIISSFLTGGFIQLMHWWIHTDNNYTVDDMQKHLEKLLRIDKMGYLLENDD